MSRRVLQRTLFEVEASSLRLNWIGRVDFTANALFPVYRIICSTGGTMQRRRRRVPPTAEG